MHNAPKKCMRLKNSRDKVKKKVFTYKYNKIYQNKQSNYYFQNTN